MKKLFELSRMPLLERPIDVSLLSVRTHNALRRAGYKTMGDIASKTRKEIMEERNFGAATKKEIFILFDQLGVPFAGDEESDDDSN